MRSQVRFVIGRDALASIMLIACVAVVVVVAGTSSAVGVDGYQLQGTLTGTVFEDTDGDGTQNGGELGIPNIDVVVTDYLLNPTTVATNASVTAASANMNTVRRFAIVALDSGATPNRLVMS